MPVLLWKRYGTNASRTTRRSALEYASVQLVSVLMVVVVVVVVGGWVRRVLFGLEASCDWQREKKKQNKSRAIVIAIEGLTVLSHTPCEGREGVADEVWGDDQFQPLLCRQLQQQLG